MTEYQIHEWDPERLRNLEEGRVIFKKTPDLQVLVDHQVITEETPEYQLLTMAIEQDRHVRQLYREYRALTRKLTGAQGVDEDEAEEEEEAQLDEAPPPVVSLEADADALIEQALEEVGEDYEAEEIDPLIVHHKLLENLAAQVDDMFTVLSKEIGWVTDEVKAQHAPLAKEVWDVEHTTWGTMSMLGLVLLIVLGGMAVLAAYGQDRYEDLAKGIAALRQGLGY